MSRILGAPQPNIIQHGILPHETLKSTDFNAHVGVENIGDEQLISLSISAASQKIFTAKTKYTAEEDWVILFLDPSILWTYDCRFCFCNAATKEMQYYQKNRYIGGPWALDRMFSDEMSPPSFKGTSYRKTTGIPTFLTTDPCAEVQVFGRIAPEDIIGAWACRLDLAEAVQIMLNDLSGQERDVLSGEFSNFFNGFSEWIISESIM
ncbi:MAG: DUF4433 domain-containing protein [Rhodobacteraceae bacterium]|nr:DUF4433 domain-containing protein [Paracoccaceae bacterium]